MHKRLLRLAVVAAVVGAATFAVVPAIARTGVDPSTLNPPPPDFFNAQCYLGAGGTICTLAFSDDPIVGESSGIMCGTTELLFSQTRSVVGKRFYDGDRNLVQRHFREQLDGTYSNPVTHRSVNWTQDDTVIHNLAVPGDLSTGTEKIAGLIRVSSGGSTILIDAGTVVLDAGTGEILHSSGPHPFQDYFENGNLSALQPICDAVA
jgi:hypothetical protein